MLLYNRLPVNLWRLSMSFLPIPFLIVRIPMLSKFFNDEVVWHPHSSALLWREMEDGGEGVHDRIYITHFHGWTLTEYEYNVPVPISVLFQSIKVRAPVYQIKVLCVASGLDRVTSDEQYPNGELHDSGFTLMFEAIYVGRDDVVKMLLDFGVDPNHVNSYGMSAPRLSLSDKMYDIISSHPRTLDKTRYYSIAIGYGA